MQDIEKIIEEAQRLRLQVYTGHREEWSRALVELRALFGLEDDKDDNNPSPINGSDGRASCRERV